MSVKAKLPDKTRVWCAWGRCVHSLAPDGSIVGGFGDIVCPCDHLKGWASKWPAGQPKPSLGWAVRGRHGSRVQRARRRKSGVKLIVTSKGRVGQVDARMWEVFSGH